MLAMTTSPETSRPSGSVSVLSLSPKAELRRAGGQRLVFDEDAQALRRKGEGEIVLEALDLAQLHAFRRLQRELRDGGARPGVADGHVDAELLELLLDELGVLLQLLVVDGKFRMRAVQQLHGRERPFLKPRVLHLQHVAGDGLELVLDELLRLGLGGQLRQ